MLSSSNVYPTILALNCDPSHKMSNYVTFCMHIFIFHIFCDTKFITVLCPYSNSVRSEKIRRNLFFTVNINELNVDFMMQYERGNPQAHLTPRFVWYS